jgi:multicomponent K+:H+ antiporter subunit E
VKRLLPHPTVSAATFAAWLLLNATIEPGHIVLATVLALCLPVLLGDLLPDVRVARRPARALRLVGTLLRDIVLANLQVARRILGPESAIRPSFIWLPLDITHPHGIVALAAMITMTPGTLSADVSADQRWLLLHAFDVADEAAVIEDIKQRYEAPLMELFP